MRREAIATAATIDEAIEAARLELGIGDEVDVEIEIIDQPEKKVLGLFGGKPAKVCLSYDDGKKEEKPKRDKKPAPKADKKPEKKAAPAKKAPKAEAKPAKAVTINQKSLDNTLDFVKNVLSHMDIGEFTCSVSDVDGGFCITVDGEGMGAVIGRRGETLDAIQYLASLCYNNEEEGFVRVVVDTNNYRAKREDTLTALALRMANQAKKSGRNQALEPMNPYERRVIHTAVQDVEGVTSWSVGDSKGRRVIIGLADEEGNPINPDERPSRQRSGGRDRDRRGGRGGRSSRGGRGSAYTPAEPTREKRSDASDLPLFGRIDNK